MLPMKIELTAKQAEYVREAHHRWNFAVGAVRSGKSWLAVQYTIPAAVVEMRGKRGLNLIVGSTRDNIERNVLTPMRDIWGDSVVGDINQHSIVRIAGEKVLCIGAEKQNQVARLRGSEVKFAYCDEVADVHPDVFDMLKSRLSLPWSVCHAACNPAGPRHYIKRFLDTAEERGIDVYCQHYTLYDNPFLPDEYVHALEAEYAGTVYHDRYIRGLWTQAEGLVYPMHETAREARYTGEAGSWCMSVDYGTLNAFAALLWAYDGKVWHVVDEYRYSGRDEGHCKTDDEYLSELLDFTAQAKPVGKLEVIIDPSAASMIQALRKSGRFKATPARNDVLDGIRETASCIQRGLVKVGDNCRGTWDEFAGYVWDDKSAEDRPVKVEDHCMDALRYFVATKQLYRRAVRDDGGAYVPLVG